MLLVGLGGTLGALARYGVDAALAGRRATFSVNVLGSFALGALAAASAPAEVLLVFGAGFCGAFTTFSSFAVETTEQYANSGSNSAVRLAVVHLVGALVAIAVGSLLGGVLL